MLSVPDLSCYLNGSSKLLIATDAKQNGNTACPRQSKAAMLQSRNAAF
jgi:hypothetical protein